MCTATSCKAHTLTQTYTSAGKHRTKNITIEPSLAFSFHFHCASSQPLPPSDSPQPHRSSSAQIALTNCCSVALFTAPNQQLVVVPSRCPSSNTRNLRILCFRYRAQSQATIYTQFRTTRKVRFVVVVQIAPPPPPSRAVASKYFRIRSLSR